MTLKGHCQVIWTDGKTRSVVEEMHDKPYALCRWWISQHKDEQRFRDGKLIIVSLMKAKQKLCPNCNEKWDGIECKSCGFDSGCFDPHYDLD